MGLHLCLWAPSDHIRGLQWCHYLLGHPFVIFTDHRSLKDQMLQVIQTPGQQTYLSKLLRYDYTIKYKFDSSNTVTNTLSRILAAKDT